MNLLNESVRVQNLLQAIDEMEEPLVLQSLCQVCHNLLISNKLAVHKYRYGTFVPNSSLSFVFCCVLLLVHALLQFTHSKKGLFSLFLCSINQGLNRFTS